MNNLITIIDGKVRNLFRNRYFVDFIAIAKNIIKSVGDLLVWVANIQLVQYMLTASLSVVAGVGIFAVGFMAIFLLSMALTIINKAIEKYIMEEYYELASDYCNKGTAYLVKDPSVYGFDALDYESSIKGYKNGKFNGHTIALTEITSKKRLVLKKGYEHYKNTEYYASVISFLTGGIIRACYSAGGFYDKSANKYSAISEYLSWVDNYAFFILIFIGLGTPAGLVSTVITILCVKVSQVVLEKLLHHDIKDNGRLEYKAINESEKRQMLVNALGQLENPQYISSSEAGNLSYRVKIQEEKEGRNVVHSATFYC